MAEHKKPFPANKHETRLVTESRPAGIAASMFREEAGSSIDMVMIVGEKPRVVRVSQGAYSRLVADGTQFFGWDFTIAGTASATNWVQIGTLPIPAGMVLDITSIRFVIEMLLSPGAGTNLYFPVPDDWLFRRARFRVRIGATMPWDQYTVYTAGVAPNPGWYVLNEEYLQFMDTAVHLVAQEGQVLYLEWQLDGAAPAELNQIYIIAKARGRWIPIQHYKRIVGANALE